MVVCVCEIACVSACKRVFKCTCVRVCVRECLCVRVWFLQQVHTTVVQQVGSALCSLLHHLMLIDDLHRLVINAQPAVQTDVEDICSVVATRGTVPMVIDDCGKTQRTQHVQNSNSRQEILLPLL